MKEKILELRSQGLTYQQICDMLNCSKSTVSYYCADGQKEKNKKRQQQNRKENVISVRVDNFKHRYDRRIKDKAEDFQRERIKVNNCSRLGERTNNFNWKDVINKFGWETTCYLTGKRINLYEPKTYHFDHIIPPKKGGGNGLDNLGIACVKANQAKSDMLVEDLILICKEILEHNGYKVNSL